MLKRLTGLLADSKRAPVLLTGYTLVTSALMLVFRTDFATIFYMLLLLSLLLIHLGNANRWLKIGLATVVIGIIIPIVGVENGALLNVSIMVAINVALALGLNLQVGFAGLLDLGYVGFFAAGAYLYSIFASPQAARFLPKVFESLPFGLSGDWFWLFLPLAIFAAAGLGFLLGLPVLRLRGDYLAIVTLGFGEIIRILSNNLDKPINITNGPQGITPIAAPALFGINLDKSIHFYFIAMALMVIVMIVMKRLEISRIGRAWASIREDEIAARAMGVPLTKLKLLAFATGAAFAGAMGMVFAIKQTFINPASFTFNESIAILAMVILGGLGSIPGAVIGATVVTVVRMQVLTDLANSLATYNLPEFLNLAKYQPLIFGLILILMMRYRQEGLLPSRRKPVDIDELMKGA
ncbi:MAG TPA: branched-chain amino acid ABC transporter permease [Symbiobacteriaceae bacterium]|nr:branched-chain amino acid ABC transporter permease [Symbiobacteriaceae bacterium]